MVISALKNTFTILIRYYSTQKLLRFSSVILCNCVAQGASKLPEVKVECLKEMESISLSYVNCVLGHIFYFIF